MKIGNLLMAFLGSLSGVFFAVELPIMARKDQVVIELPVTDFGKQGKLIITKTECGSSLCWTLSEVK